MKKIMLFIFLCFDLMLSFAQYGTVVYNIPAAGQTVTVPAQYLNNSFIALQTAGPVNLASNTYTLTYAALPPNGFTWRVKMDFRRLTQSASGANVTIFGVKPLQAHPTVDTFDITYSVIPDSLGTKYLYYIYNGLGDFGKFNAATTFNGDVTFNDRTFFNGRNYINDTTTFYGSNIRLAPVSVITIGQALAAADTTGKITWGCAPWCVTGNSGLSNSNFLGNTDTVGLNFRVNNYTAGRIDYTLQNTSLGYGAIKSNTSGNQNVAIGFSALFANTTGTGNTGIGYGSLVATTTGTGNVGIGAQAAAGITTGSGNTGIGNGALGTVTTGDYNIGIGEGTSVAANSTTKSIAIGYTAAAGNYGVALGTVTAAANTLAFYPRAIYAPNATTAIRYVWTDTSGSGNFVPQPLPNYAAITFTPVTGDSISVTTSQNDINPAGTLAVLTVILPASPYSGQILEFSTTQVLTSLLWSVRLSGGTTLGLPSTLAQYGTVKIKWNSTLSKWLNY